MSSPPKANPVFQGQVARPQVGLRKPKWLSELRILGREGLHQASSVRSRALIPWLGPFLHLPRLPENDGVKLF